MSRSSLVVPCALAAFGALLAVPALGAAEESTSISGKMFADLTSLSLKNDGVESSANGVGIDVKRFYLGVTHSFDSVWSANVTTDFNYVSNDAQTQLYIKKAYLQAKLSDAFTARLGSADLPWVPFVEDVYGYRYVENVIIDRLKFGTSADWGVHAGGKLSGGLVSYAASVVNGAGYKNPTRSNSMDLEFRLATSPVKGLTLAAGGYRGKLGKDIEGATTVARHTAERWDALASYVAGPWRAGAEYFQAKNWNQVTSIATDKADGYSVFASYDFTPRLSLFGRADRAKTSKDLAPDLEDKYFNIGLATHPRKNVDISVVYKHEQVDGGGLVATSNGAIGGLREGKFNEFGVWAQVVF